MTKISMLRNKTNMVWRKCKTLAFKIVILIGHYINLELTLIPLQTQLIGITTVKDVFWGMTEWPLNTCWPFHTGLTNLGVYQENQDGDNTSEISIARQVDPAKGSTKCLPHLVPKKEAKERQRLCTVFLLRWCGSSWQSDL